MPIFVSPQLPQFPLGPGAIQKRIGAHCTSEAPRRLSGAQIFHHVTRHEDVHSKKAELVMSTVCDIEAMAQSK